jgi:chloramphenicol-sensitive protein RarD
MTRGAERAGLGYGVAAYGLWGLVPLYFRALNYIAPAELLAQRVVWSTVLLALVMTVIRGWGLVRGSAGARRTRRTLLATSILIGVNWYLYIFAATNQMLVEASLGYFIAPLVNTALGVLVLRERLRPAQMLAIVLAGTGVLVLTIQQGSFPWLALGLALSFSVYGLLRKTTAADALTGLMIESLVLTAPALAYIAWDQRRGAAQFGQRDRITDLLLAAGSVVTVVPLFCFAQAARRLRLTTMGFLQFLSPTVQFVLAITILGERFEVTRLYGFGPIWLALIVYSVGAVIHVRRAWSGPVPVMLPE